MPNFDVRDAFGSVITIESSVIGTANRQVVTTSLGNSSVMLLNSSAVIGSVAVLQGTSPWAISSVYGNISGSVVSFPGANQSVSGTVNLGIGTEMLGSVATLQGTNPWV